jgi:hypothetical protein
MLPIALATPLRINLQSIAEQQGPFTSKEVFFLLKTPALLTTSTRG